MDVSLRRRDNALVRDCDEDLNALLVLVGSFFQNSCHSLAYSCLRPGWPILYSPHRFPCNLLRVASGGFHANYRRSPRSAIRPDCGSCHAQPRRFSIFVPARNYGPRDKSSLVLQPGAHPRRGPVRHDCQAVASRVPHMANRGTSGRDMAPPNPVQGLHEVESYHHSCALTGASRGSACAIHDRHYRPSVDAAPCSRHRHHHLLIGPACDGLRYHRHPHLHASLPVSFTGRLGLCCPMGKHVPSL